MVLLWQATEQGDNADIEDSGTARRHGLHDLFVRAPNTARCEREVRDNVRFWLVLHKRVENGHDSDPTEA